MLRSEIQKETGLTRKAIEYYEDKGLIHPQKSENGYRDYNIKDLEILKKVSIFRKLGMSISDIYQCIWSGGDSLSSVLREKQHQLDLDEKRKVILEMIVKCESKELINEKVSLLEMEETIYEKLEIAFPGYFGQMFFAAYQPFLNEPLENDVKVSFYKYIDYFDRLPAFELTEEEKKYIDKISAPFDMKTLRDVNQAKVDAIESPEKWIKDNEDVISQYETYKNSEEYQNSMIKQIQDKLKNFMKENQYYEIAIPLIRKFSKSYDNYYKKLLKANKEYLNNKYQ
ncbi:MerR family transcriptional regulator [Peptoniphilus lacrimalis]|uniref:MerR family transcriptional regulator n=1 Tax=Peptoniphilus lacrimalis TaxID=33031 RepID=UPI0023F689CA|nr:MerR family transcriptional regulator [Peptoniphilus lacrimalis]MDK7722404.1 MerR family transcriptional regulator [Peptoniphilus lacrimalis]MDK7732006.1 MerR family transcriptional regulator [Peptoniphilus lacrimalis]